MKHKPTHYEFPIAGAAWTKGAGHPAGIYHLDGRIHFAAHQSPAEAALRERGALLVASVRFDRDPLEAAHPGHPVRPLGAHAALHRLAPPTRN
jgi:hypothetical protein